MHSGLAVAILIACSQALPLEQHHQATSFVSFNSHHNTVHHVHSAPALVKTPVAIPVHTPIAIKSVAPILAAPHAGLQSYSSLSLAHSAPTAHHSAPIAVAHAAPVVVKAPVIVKHHEEEHYAPAKYEFAYGIEDHHTGDIHSQKEVRDGDVTQGEYSLHEPDGTVRTVKYTVDKHSGFNAIVERSGHAVHAQPVKAVVAAPVVKAVVPSHFYHH